MKFDLAIAYRIYPRVSKVPFIFPDNKLKLAEVGIRTLKNSLGSLSCKIFFLLDNCPEEYEQMIRKYFTGEGVEFFHLPGIGNLNTFGKQVDLLLNQNVAEVVFFAEDDYVYRTHAIAPALSFLKRSDVDFVTPYDHLDSYVLPIHTRHSYELAIHEGLHWRTSASTCMTFLTTRTALKATEQTFRSYCSGNWDSSLWFALTKYNVFDLPAIIGYLIRDRFLFKTVALSWIRTFGQTLLGKKYKLWQPIPAIGTHMERDLLSPNVDWNEVARG